MLFSFKNLCQNLTKEIKVLIKRFKNYLRHPLEQERYAQCYRWSNVFLQQVTGLVVPSEFRWWDNSKIFLLILSGFPLFVLPLTGVWCLWARIGGNTRVVFSEPSAVSSSDGCFSGSFNQIVTAQISQKKPILLQKGCREVNPGWSFNRKPL